LKKADNKVNRSFLVDCFVHSDISVIKAKMSSDVREDRSTSPKWFKKLLRMIS
jgi:hypothetical protein